MENTTVKTPIPLSRAMEKYDLTRSTIDRKHRDGVFTKFTLPGSTKVYLDEQQIIDAFIKKD